MTTKIKVRIALIGAVLTLGGASSAYADVGYDTYCHSQPTTFNQWFAQTFLCR